MNRTALYITIIIAALSCIRCVENICLGVECDREQILIPSENGTVYVMEPGFAAFLTWPDDVEITYMDGSLEDIRDEAFCDHRYWWVEFTATTTITVTGSAASTIRVCRGSE